MVSRREDLEKVIDGAYQKTTEELTKGSVLRNHAVQPIQILNTLINMSYRSVGDILDRITTDQLKGDERSQAIIELKSILDSMVKNEVLSDGFDSTGPFIETIYSPLGKKSLSRMIKGIRK